MQFITNYNVLHARTAYEDDRGAGLIRHLKRLWLSTGSFGDRTEHFECNISSHGEKARWASRLAIH